MNPTTFTPTACRRLAASSSPYRVKLQLSHLHRGKCRYCGRTPFIRNLEIDQKFPMSRGGGNGWSNLQLLCVPCNMRKGIQSDEEFRDRYWELLPEDRSPLDLPISQEDFNYITTVTRAAPQVPRIYHRSFQAARRRRGYPPRPRRRLPDSRVGPVVPGCRYRDICPGVTVNPPPSGSEPVSRYRSRSGLKFCPKQPNCLTPKSGPFRFRRGGDYDPGGVDDYIIRAAIIGGRYS